MVEENRTSKIFLNLSAKGLTTLEKSVCIVLIKDSSSKYIEYGRTENSSDSSNPIWIRNISLNFYFSKKQEIRFLVQNIFGNIIGYYDIFLAQLVKNKENEYFLEENDGLKRILITVTEQKIESSKLIIQLRANNVDKMDFFGKSDPYFILFKRTETSYEKVYKSEIIKKTLNPVWKPFELHTGELCNNDFQQVFRLECWDWDRAMSDDFIGAVDFTLARLSVPNSKHPLFDPKKHQKNPKKYKNSGILEVDDFQILKNYSFLEYLRSGLNIGLVINIDFTASNIDPRAKNSLHHVDAKFQNDYEKLITAFGEAVEFYDKEKNFPLFGFGAEPNWTNKVEHCFSLNKNIANPFVTGLKEVIETYHQVLDCVKLAGPTLYQFVVRAAMSISQISSPVDTYYLVLVLVDGEAHDVEHTISAIVESSRLPLSFLFVGVGFENFSSMRVFLEHPLKDGQGNVAVRDNVQFMTLKSFAGNAQLLAQSMMEKIPQQVVEYMAFVKYQPDLD